MGHRKSGKSAKRRKRNGKPLVIDAWLRLRAPLDLVERIEAHVDQGGGGNLSAFVREACAAKLAAEASA
jgi:hypothetical protein